MLVYIKQTSPGFLEDSLSPSPTTRKATLTHSEETTSAKPDVLWLYLHCGELGLRQKLMQTTSISILTDRKMTKLWKWWGLGFLFCFFQWQNSRQQLSLWCFVLTTGALPDLPVQVTSTGLWGSLIGFEMLLTREEWVWGGWVWFGFGFFFLLSTTAWAGLCLLCLPQNKTSSQEYLYDIYGASLQRHL